MTIIDRGSGPPLVFIPGLQGRWEYMRRAVEALAESCRVITFSLADEPSARYPFERSKGLDSFVDQVEAALNERGIARAAICGVSFGGIVALRAAARRPGRISSLILVSTPEPGWRLRRAHAIYAALPWLFFPLFLAGMPGRLRAEFSAALPARRDRVRFKGEQVLTFLHAPLGPTRMARRAKLIGSADLADECARISVPTLVVTGEPELDHVVSGGGGSSYSRLISGARLVRLDRTGHLGCLTRPRAFAAIVTAFLNGQRDAAA